MRRVVIISPLSGDVKRNIEYARACLLDSLRRGECPLAGHLLYTQVLDDTIAEDRDLGMRAGQAWLTRADAAIVCLDRGMSGGMDRDIYRARMFWVPIEERRLGGEWADG